MWQKESEPVEAHHHTDACYKKELVCGLKEHTHTAACYSNESADVEDKSDWEATIPELSGNWAEDIVAVAQSQLGYEESTANFKLADDGETRQGYTRYGEWYGNKYGDWSAMFASFCLNYAGIPAKTVPVNSGCIAWITELKEQKLYKTADDYKPVAGDLVFLDTDSDEKADHVGIITEVEKEDGKIVSVKAIVGDSSDKVEENTYEADGADKDVIIGYCALPENPDEKKADETDKTEAESTTATTAEDKTEAEVTTEEKATSEADTTTEKAEATTEKGEEKTESTEKATDEKTVAVSQDAEKTAYTPFNPYVTSLEGSGTKYDKDTGNYETNLKTNFTISKEQIKEDNYSYELNYPEGIIVPDELLNNNYRLLDDQNQQAGSYSFVKNEDGTYSVRVVFDQDYVRDAGDTISGNIWFKGKLSSTKVDDKGDIIIAGEDKVKLDIPSKDITYPDDETDKYNIDVSKSGSVIEGGKLKYTVIINSTKGTPEDIDFTDIIDTTNMNLGTPEVSVKKQPVKWYNQWNHPVDSSKEEDITSTISPAYDSETGKLSMTLPQLTATKQNDYIDCFQYVVTYTYDITGMDIDSTKAGNTVTVKSHDQKTDTTVKDDASTNVDVNNPYTISKSGEIADGKQIKWTLTVNDKKANIAGATVSDTMFKDIPSNAEIKVSPNKGYTIEKDDNGKIKDIKFEGVDNGKNNEKYTITYYTPYEQKDDEQNIINDATFKPSNGKELHDKDTVKIPGCSIQKKLDGVTGTDAGKATLKWTVSMDVPDAGLASGTLIKDDMTKNKDDKSGKPQYMTVEQVKAWAGKMQWDNGDTLDIQSKADVIFKDAKGKEYTYADIIAGKVAPDTQFTNFEITLKENVLPPKGATKLTYTYETTADLSSASKGENKYYNTVNEDGKKADAEYTYNNNHSISKKGSVDAKNNRIKWTITVNKNKADIAGSVLSDPMFTQISEGTDLIIDPNNGYEFEYDDNGKIKDIKFNEVSNGQNTQKYTITYYTSYTPSWNQETETNTATLKPGTGESISATDDVDIPGGSVSKKVDTVTEKADGKANVKWNVTITTPGGKIPQYTVKVKENGDEEQQQVYIYDEMSSSIKDDTSHYMTVKQIQDWNGQMQWGDGEPFDISAEGQAKVEFKRESDGKYYTLDEIRKMSPDEDAKFIKMRITLLKDLVNTDNDSTTLKYSYDTTVDLSNASAGKNKYVNKVKIENKSSSATYTYENKHTVSKIAEKVDGNEIKWTITVNENQVNIAGGILKDEMFDKITDITKLTVNPDDKTGYEIIKEKGEDGKEKIKEIRFKGMDKDGKNTNKYTITYYTPYENKWDKKEQKITNKASFKPPTGEEIETTKTITIPGCSLEKSMGQVNESEDKKTATINWTVGVEIPDAGFPKDTVITDDMTKNTSNATGSTQYMTVAQVKAWGGNVNWDNNKSFNIFDDAWSEVTFYDAKGKTYTYADIQNAENGVTDNTKFIKFKIRLKKELTKPSGATKLTYSYETTADLSDIPMGENKYYNSAWVGNKGADATYTYDKGKVVKKDGNGNTETTSSSSENELTWKIEVTTGSDEYNTIKVSDALPKGLKLKEISVTDNSGRKIDSLKVDDSGNISGQNDTYKVNGTYTNGTVNLNLSYVDLSKKIPKNTTYTFTVVCQTEDDSKYGNNTKYTFTNTANVTFDNKEIGSSSQTQEWTKKTNTVEHKVVDKTGTWDGNSHQADYSIVLNPDGKNIVEGSDVLTLTDVLSSTKHPYYATSKDGSSIDYNDITFTVELIPTSVKLYYAVRNSDGSYGKGSNPQQVQGYKWTYTSEDDPYSSNFMKHKLILDNVPDGTPLILEYSYSVDRDAPSNVKDAQFKIDNTATLSGQTSSSDSSGKTEMWKESSTGGQVSTEKSYTIYKVEEGNYGKLLQGAIFKLQKYDATNAEDHYSDVNPEKTFNTNKNGKIQIKWDASLYQYNTLYRLVETTPPTGYSLSSEDTEIYFYFSKKGDTNNLPDSIPSKAIDLTKKSSTVYVENKSNNTSISIKKNWKDSEGTTISAPVNEIKVDLYRRSSTIKPGEAGSDGNGTVTIKTNTTKVGTVDLTYPIGTKITYRLSYKWANWNKFSIIATKDGENLDVQQTTEEEKEGHQWRHYDISFTVDAVNNINITSQDSTSNDWEGKVTSVVEPQEDSKPKAEVVGSYTITANERWQKIIEDLPLTGKENGKKVYYTYYIKEQNESDYKKVEYTNNDGITSGIITIVNTTSEAYSLPKTGGSGTLPFITGGAFLMGFALLSGYSMRRRRGRRVE